jgi:hypothetical protein
MYNASPKSATVVSALRHIRRKLNDGIVGIFAMHLYSQTAINNDERLRPKLQTSQRYHGTPDQIDIKKKKNKAPQAANSNKRTNGNRFSESSAQFQTTQSDKMPTNSNWCLYESHPSIVIFPYVSHPSNAVYPEQL